VPARDRRRFCVHRWIEHTSELELALEGSEEREIFAAALAALNELLDDRSRGRPERHEVVLRSPERATLLADWLDELVFLAETEGFVPERASVLELAPGGLRATVEGHRGRPPHLVKAVTYHGLEFAAEEERVRARVVLDV
jgi:SHS2 domain-containing protein